MPIPSWKLTVDGREVSGALAPWFRSLHVVDRIGLASDRCTLEFAAPPDVALPETAWRGALLRPAIGYEDTGAGELGAFAVDTMDIAGPAVRTRITARSVIGATQADRRLLRGSVPDDSSARFTTPGLDTLAGVLQAISRELDLDAPEVDAAVAGKLVGQNDWRGRSWGAVLRELAEKWGCNVQIFDGAIRMKLLAASRGARTLRLGQVSQWRATVHAGRELPKVIAHWVPPPGAASAAGGSETFGDGEPVRILEAFEHRLQTAEQAAAAAKAESLRSRKANSFTATMPGDPDMQPGVLLALEEWDERVPANWRIVEASHRIDANGYVTALTAEDPELDGRWQRP